MAPNRAFTEGDDAIIRQHWHKVPTKELARLLDRSRSSVLHRACYIGLHETQTRRKRRADTVYIRPSHPIVATISTWMQANGNFVRACDVACKFGRNIFAIEDMFHENTRLFGFEVRDGKKFYFVLS